MLFITRHGESYANVRGEFAGQKDDSELTSNGKEGAQATSREVTNRNIRISRIIASPLKRANETTQIIADAIGLSEDEVTTDSRLTEYDMGQLTGTPIRPIPSREFIAAEGAEPIREFEDRVMACVEEARNLLGNTLLVAHGGVMRIIEAAQQGIDPRDFMDLPLPPNGTLAEL